MDPVISGHVKRIVQFVGKDYRLMYREPGGEIRHPFLTPGSDQYSDILWDWDSWLTDIALRQIVRRQADSATEARQLTIYEQGCIMNWLEFAKKSSCVGWVPIWVNRTGNTMPEDVYAQNMHLSLIHI